MIAVGIDVSLTWTGVSVIDTETGSVIAQRVQSPASGDSLLARRARIRRAVDQVLHVVPEHFDMALLEKPLPAMSGKDSLQTERAAAYWFIVDQLARRGPLAEVHPSTRACIAAGRPAPKKEVLTAVRAAWPHVFVKDDNVADSLAMAGAAASHLGAPQVAYTPEQEAAIARVAWPESKGI